MSLLHRKRAFFHGPKSEFSQMETGLHRSFASAADVLPIELIDDKDLANFDDVCSLHKYEWHKDKLSDAEPPRYQLIKRCKLKFDKPILVIYNPNSGQKKNYIPLIIDRLKAA